MGKAHLWNVPLYIGEFDAYGPLTDDPSSPKWIKETSEMMKFCKENNISWSYWAYQRTTKPLDGAGGTGPLNDSLLKVLQSGMNNQQN